MAIGHEFVGEIVEVGSNVTDFFPGRHRQRRRPRGLRPLPQLPGRAAPSVRAHAGRGREPAGRVRRIHRAADDQHLASPRRRRPLDVAAIFDPFGNAVHTALSFPVLGEDVLITGAGPIGIMAAAVAQHAGRALRRDHRRESVPPGTGAQDGRDRGAVNVRETKLADVQKQLGMTEGFDVGLEMSGNAAGVPRHARQHEPRRENRHARHSRSTRWPSTGAP